MMSATLDSRADALGRDSYYEASVTRPATDDPILDSTVDADVCVIGAGYAGLSVALECRERGLSVVVLDAHRPGWGASGRNGGQTLAGFAKDEEMERQLGTDGARAAWAMSIAGVELLKERIDRYGIDCDFTPGYMTVATKTRRIADLQRWMDKAQSHWGHTSLSWIDGKDMPSRIASTRYVAGVYDSLSGHLHPLKYCLGLANAARLAGARLYAHSPVMEVQRGAHPLVKTQQGAVRCHFVVACGNATIEGVLPDAISARIAPIASYIVATEALDPARAEALITGRPAVCDNNFMLDYFRVSPDHRVLFGGRASSAGGSPAALSTQIKQRMLGVFPQLADVRIEHAWGGFVDVTRNRTPDFGAIDPNFLYVQGFSGHGVALTGIAGRVLARAITGEKTAFDLFTRLHHARFPGGKAWRRPALEIGMLYHRLLDMV